jgi:hypothetical protein
MVLLALGFARLAHAAGDDANTDDANDVSVTPYRPTVSTPAQLSAPGWFEGEFGGLDTVGPGRQRRASLPYTIKFAFTQDWGVRFGGDGFVASTDDHGNTERGFGDTSVTLKRRFAIDDAQAFGLELTALAPTARSSIGNGRAAYGMTGIYSIDFAGNHADVNLFETRLGAEPQVSAWQEGYALAISRPVNDQWGALMELSGFHQQGLADTDQLLAGATYNVSKRLVIDMGGLVGLTHASPRFGVFTGFTVLLGRLY